MIETCTQNNAAHFQRVGHHLSTGDPERKKGESYHSQVGRLHATAGQMCASVSPTRRWRGTEVCKEGRNMDRSATARREKERWK